MTTEKRGGTAGYFPAVEHRPAASDGAEGRPVFEDQREAFCGCPHCFRIAAIAMASAASAAASRRPAGRRNSSIARSPSLAKSIPQRRPKGHAWPKNGGQGKFCRILRPFRPVRVHVDVLPGDGGTVMPEFQVIIKMVGGGEVMQPFTLRLRHDIADRVLAVRRVPCVHVRVDVYHSSTAFILLTPAEELCSFTMRNLPSSAVFAAWGPPHISLLSPMVYTFTMSP